MSRQLMLSVVTFLTLTGCSAATTPSSTDTATQQALAEAAASAQDAQATADACFDAYDTCRAAADADVASCRSQLKDCLPQEAHPGPHCGPPRGKGKGSPHGPNGGQCDGGGPPANGGPPSGGAPPEGQGAPPDGQGGQRGPGGGPGGGPGDGDGGAEPPFCGKVPLPPPEAVRACHDTLDTCLKGGTDPKTCFDADHACTKAAFDAARNGSAGASTSSSDPVVN